MDARLIVNVVDSLESTSSTDALSANQGRVLKEMIDANEPIQSYTHNGKNGVIQFANGFLIQHGRIGITPSAVNVPTYQTVTFDVPYTDAPVVIVTPITNYPNYVFASSRNTGLTSTEIYLVRDALHETGIEWIAMGYKSLGE